MEGGIFPDTYKHTNVKCITANGGEKRVWVEWKCSQLFKPLEAAFMMFLITNFHKVAKMLFGTGQGRKCSAQFLPVDLDPWAPFLVEDSSFALALPCWDALMGEEMGRCYYKRVMHFRTAKTK